MLMMMLRTALLLLMSLGLAAGAAGLGTLSDFGQSRPSRGPRLPTREPSKVPGRARPPRVGTIKNYEATGLATGCANLYFYPAKRPAAAPPEAYVFLSRAGGEDAWMNLDGRDVRLVLLKTSTLYRAGKPTRWQSDYRAGATRIRVVTTPGSNPEGPSLLMTITATRAGFKRIVKAVGDSDC